MIAWLVEHGRCHPEKWIPICYAASCLPVQDHTAALLKAIGVSDGPKGGPKARAGRVGRSATREAHFSDDGSQSGGQELPDPPGSLGAKLQELGKRLLQVRSGRHTIA